MTTAIATTRAPLADLHRQFEPVLPAIHAAGHRHFAALHREDREDAVADATLSAWKRFLRAVTENIAIDPADLARRAVAAVARRLQIDHQRRTLQPA